MAGERVVIAEDDALLREGIASLLTGGGYVVAGQVGDAETLLEAVRESCPDLVVLDIRMPPSQTWEGLDAARAIRSEFPSVGILLLSAHVEIDIALDLLESSERIGYLLKNRIARAADLFDALDRIAAGGSVVDPGLIRQLLNARQRSDRLADLTTRERQVLTLMAEGRSNSGIAEAMYVTEGAVEKHVRHILAKLDLPAQSSDHRRVLAVLAFLDGR
ncbi:MAG: response regulator transcription factor [Solirubrobacterales bacterium]|nr:response regulator transcription factor [Solirubrobacterales bacterium]